MTQAQGLQRPFTIKFQPSVLSPALSLVLFCYLSDFFILFYFYLDSPKLPSLSFFLSPSYYFILQTIMKFDDDDDDDDDMSMIVTLHVVIQLNKEDRLD